MINLVASPWASTAFAKEAQASDFRRGEGWQSRCHHFPLSRSFSGCCLSTPSRSCERKPSCKVSRHPARSGGWQKAWKMQFFSNFRSLWLLWGIRRFWSSFSSFWRWQWVLFLWGGDVGSKSELGVVGSTFDSQVGSWVHLPLQRWGRGLQPGNLCHLPGGAPPMFVPRVALAAQQICWNLNALPQDPWSSHLET